MGKENGFAHILGSVLLLVGLVIAVVLVGQQTNFLPKAYNPVSSRFANEASSSGIPQCSTDPCVYDLKKDPRNQVNAQDYAVLSSCSGKPLTATSSAGTSCAPADFNTDGKIDQKDADCLKQPQIYYKTCTTQNSNAVTNTVFLDVDSDTKEIYNLNVGAKVTTVEREEGKEKSAGPIYLSSAIFEISGDVANSFTELSGYAQSEKVPYGSKTIEFSYNSSGSTRFISKPVLLDNFNQCFDLYRSKDKIDNKYLATFCYRAGMTSSSVYNSTFYSYNSNQVFHADYVGQKVISVLYLSPAFNNKNTRPPRVSYLAIDEEANKNDFKNITYYIGGVGSLTSNKDYAEWCLNDGKHPPLYVVFHATTYPSGYPHKVDGHGRGTCNYAYSSPSLVVGYMSLYKDGWQVPITKIKLNP